MSLDCFLKSKDGKKYCGQSGGVSGVVRLTDCNDKVANYLIGFIFPKKPSVKKRLYLQRLTYLTSLKRIYIECGYATGIVVCWERFWRSSKVTCQYPGHSGDKKCVRGRAGVNWDRGGIARKFGWGCAAHS